MMKMNTKRSPTEAIQDALHQIIASKSPDATGMHIMWDGIRFGTLTNRKTAPHNYIFFNEPPAPPIPLYREPVEAYLVPAPSGEEDRISLNMNKRQAYALYRMTGHVGGSPGGARGAFDKIAEALHPTLLVKDIELEIEGYPFFFSSEPDPA